MAELTALPADGAALDALLASQGASGFVYTVRDNAGQLFWASPSGQAQAVKAGEEETVLLRTLCGGDALAVARFNVLHDSYYAFANMQDAAICQAKGYVWYDNHSYHWREPEKALARQYVVGLAVECAQLGFDELLLEELCYPTRGNTYKISYANNTMAKRDALALLLAEIREALEPYGTKISLLLTEEQLLEGSNEDSGVDLAALLPLADGVYAQVANPDTAQALLDAAVGEGAEPPVLVCLTAAPEAEENWCIPAA